MLKLLQKLRQTMLLSTEQGLHVALRFYATGTFQAEIGDGEGVSQSSMHRLRWSVMFWQDIWMI